MSSLWVGECVRGIVGLIKWVEYQISNFYKKKKTLNQHSGDVSLVMSYVDIKNWDGKKESNFCGHLT